MAWPSATDRPGFTAMFTSVCSLCPNHRALTSETSSTPLTSQAACRISSTTAGSTPSRIRVKIALPDCQTITRLFPPPGAVNGFSWAGVWLRSKDCRNPDRPAHAGNRSPERAEELAHVADEKVRHLHGGEMAAAVELGPVLYLVLGVHHLPHERLGGEERPPVRRRGGRAPLGRVPGLVQEVRRGGTGAREPVDRDVGQQLVELDGVLGQLRRRVRPLLEVLDDPGELPHRRVGQGVGDGLRTVGLELEVPGSCIGQRLCSFYRGLIFC